MKIRVLAAVLMAATVTAAGAPLQVTLRARNPKTLPGIPVDLRVTVANRSNAVVDLEGGAMVHVQPAGREAFWVFNKELTFDACHGDTFVEPNATIENVVDDGATKTLWDDARLNVPGVYHMTVVLNPPLWATDWSSRPADFLSLASVGADAVMSNELTVTVEMPTAEDAAVWDALIAATPETETRSAFALRHAAPATARALLERFPSSRYAPWLAYRLWRAEVLPAVCGQDWRPVDADAAARYEHFRRSVGDPALREQIELEWLTARSNAATKLTGAARAKEIAATRAAIAAFRKAATHRYRRCRAAAVLAATK